MNPDTKGSPLTLIFLICTMGLAVNTCPELPRAKTMCVRGSQHSVPHSKEQHRAVTRSSSFHQRPTGGQQELSPSHPSATLPAGRARLPLPPLMLPRLGQWRLYMEEVERRLTRSRAKVRTTYSASVSVFTSVILMSPYMSESSGQ